VILSFCNSDRGQLRDASREAVAAIGEPASWQLKDVYLSLTGQKPPREWSWDRLARELFALHDRARLAEVYKLMDDGVAAAAAAKYADAIAAFDKVLARSPLFERRKEMVPTYVVRAKELEKNSCDDALAMLRKALRLDPKGDTNHGIEAEIDYLEGALSIDRGTPDKFILVRALELDPTNDRARQALASLDEQAVVRKTSTKRYLAAAGVGLSALIGMLLLARRRKTPKDLPPSPAAPSS
jgi:tetratricopeptide (TPR) repeat protein